VYDYKRRDKFGNERPLHLDKALDVLDFSAYDDDNSAGFDRNGRVFIKTERFFACVTEIEDEGVIYVGPRSFVGVTVTSGHGFVEDREVRAGDTLFIPAGFGEAKCRGKFTAITVEVI
jgi:mannose-6-phosphate isomerase